MGAGGNAGRPPDNPFGNIEQIFEQNFLALLNQAVDFVNAIVPIEELVIVPIAEVDEVSEIEVGHQNSFEINDNENEDEQIVEVDESLLWRSLLGMNEDDTEENEMPQEQDEVHEQGNQIDIEEVVTIFVNQDFDKKESEGNGNKNIFRRIWRWLGRNIVCGRNID